MAILIDKKRFRPRFLQMVADVNDLNAHEGVGAKPLTLREVREYGTGILLAWHSDVCRRRVALGLPENVDLKDSDG
jgi:hypothetical protein